MAARSPLIRSSIALRGVATAMTLLSLGGMSVFASTHVQNTAAPLKPVAAAATPAATARTTTITGRVTTTTQAARTRTKSS